MSVRGNTKRLGPIRFYHLWALAGAVALLSSASGQSAPPLKPEMPDNPLAAGPFVFSHRAMGTEFVFTIYPTEGEGWEDFRSIADDAFAAIDTLEQDISSWMPDSNTSRINREAATRPVRAARDVWNLLQFAATTHEETGGAFDVTVGPLIDFFETQPTEFTVVDEAGHQRALARTGMDKVYLNPESHEVSFVVEGIRISFGGIGKGLALDRAAEVFERYGVESALLSGGDSSILALGAPPGRDFWKISIYNPYTQAASGLDTVRLRDQALSTSACYHHAPDAPLGTPCGIFDPATGQPVSGMLSATVVAPTGMETDALSTAFYVMGVDRVLDYCRTHPEIKAVLATVPEDGTPRPVRIGNWD